MKITPVILCGGAGTRLWPDTKKNLPKQFIDFGGWTLFEKTLQRVKNNIYSSPMIITNSSYLKNVQNLLIKHKFKKCEIILEPIKRNTAPAIALATIGQTANKTLAIFPSDHFIENDAKFNNILKKNKKFIEHKNYWNKKDIFLFGIKPKNPSEQYGYFLPTEKKRGISKVKKFIEKPNISNAKKIISKGGYWNSGMLFGTAEAFNNCFMEHDLKTLKYCYEAYKKGKTNYNPKNIVTKVNKKIFKKINSRSFDYAVLEKYNYVKGIKANIDWTDFGNWFEILKIFNQKKLKYFKKKNLFIRPWGHYINLFRGKGFLIKELFVKPKGVLSLQKHYHRSERWLITQGKAKITLDKKVFFKSINETISIPKESIHRIENNSKKPIRIMEAQIGNILKETDIVRFHDIYGRVK